ncbi:MAG TPA: hypothetical protein VGF40_12035 [Thermoanaerobaculia bacterium]
MGGINVGRWLAGGVVAAVVIWIAEGVASVLYMDDMKAALERHDLSMEMSSGVMVLGAVLSLIYGLALVFFYALARARFGPGPKTALLIAVVFWLCTYAASILGYYMLGLYPESMLGLWLVIGLVETVVATLLGAWIYREGATAPRPAAA